MGTVVAKMNPAVKILKIIHHCIHDLVNDLKIIGVTRGRGILESCNRKPKIVSHGNGVVPQLVPLTKVRAIRNDSVNIYSLSCFSSFVNRCIDIVPLKE